MGVWIVDVDDLFRVITSTQCVLHTTTTSIFSCKYLKILLYLFILRRLPSERSAPVLYKQNLFPSLKERLSLNLPQSWTWLSDVGQEDVPVFRYLHHKRRTGASMRSKKRLWYGRCWFLCLNGKYAQKSYRTMNHELWKIRKTRSCAKSSRKMNCI